MRILGVDCSRAAGNEGCVGGLYENSWAHIRSYGGIMSNYLYHYSAIEQHCQFSPNQIAAKLDWFQNHCPRDELASKEAVATVGPVSVAIEASCYGFKDYSQGVYSSAGCGSYYKSLNHAALVVGYGTESGEDYWLVKNSWGTGWGDRGYVKILRNWNNMCGIAWRGAFPTV